ncbi:MAG TPA: CBS domain-containing protein [Candidatus Acidoferrales bacterium]|nr:CBS domain-containing protein [Candidatus Acidoferrales bacterium]
MPVPKLVGDIMTRELTTLEHDAKLLDAALLMRSSGFRHLPVVKDGRPVGVLSDRDVQRASPSIFSNLSPDEYNRLFETIPVEKVMVREPMTATAETPIKEVVQVMYEQKVGSVLVVGPDKKLLGIVTNTDLLRMLNAVLDEV